MGKDQIARLEGLRRVAEVTGVLLRATHALIISTAPTSERLLIAESLQGFEPVPELISALAPAGADSGAAAIGPPADSAMRSVNRLEWTTTMGAFCQAAAFKPEIYLQLRLDEVCPSTSAIREIVDAYEQSHGGNLGAKDVGRPEQTKERRVYPKG